MSTARSGKKTAPKDPRGGHYRAYHCLIGSNAWTALPHPAVRVYMALVRKLNSSNNGNIEMTIAGLRKTDGITSSSVLARALRALEAVGMIARTREGCLTSVGRRTCVLYRATDLPLCDHPSLGIKGAPASREWEKFKTRQEAADAIKAADAAHLRHAKNAATVLEKNTHSSGEEPFITPNGSGEEHGEPKTVLEKNMVKSGRSRRQTRASARDHTKVIANIKSPHHVLEKNTFIDLPPIERSARGVCLGSDASRPCSLAAARLQDWVASGRAVLIAGCEASFAAMAESMSRYLRDTGQPPLTKQALGKALANGALPGVTLHKRNHLKPAVFYRGIRVLDVASARTTP